MPITIKVGKAIIAEMVVDTLIARIKSYTDLYGIIIIANIDLIITKNRMYANTNRNATARNPSGAPVADAVPGRKNKILAADNNIVFEIRMKTPFK
ncbi:hypothetical protein [Solemya elarraichensis gill symbiont]|uniref:hypothetical protein n=1 Tax=Solemya elarraichensis gill symbiont TaxID=1918949 RepID=UPI00108286CE|nr:hypothetical protein [Solemya elarraichensis gill symbiont]